MTQTKSGDTVRQSLALYILNVTSLSTIPHVGKSLTRCLNKGDIYKNKRQTSHDTLPLKESFLAFPNGP